MGCTGSRSHLRKVFQYSKWCNNCTHLSIFPCVLFEWVKMSTSFKSVKEVIFRCPLHLFYYHNAWSIEISKKGESIVIILLWREQKDNIKEKVRTGGARTKMYNTSMWRKTLHIGKKVCNKTSTKIETLNKTEFRRSMAKSISMDKKQKKESTMMMIMKIK
jgi:hypothetical protein